jgi:ABC-type nitrate/sulfonate/bicarbonate transport system substrate-binding protein
LIDHHFDAAVRIVDQVIGAEEWAWRHPDETRQFLARESNSSEFWVAAAYGTDAHLRLRTNLDELSITALQDFTHFLHRWQFIPNAVDVRSWIDPRVFDAALRGRGAAAA